MNRPTSRNWWIFGIGAAALTAAMTWVSVAMLRLDDEKRQANAETAHRIALSTALWRMDSWLTPQLSREAMRPYFEYEAYYPQQNAYTKMLGEIKQGEVLTPSDLLTYRSPIFQLHFQFDENGALSSPQVPTRNWLDLTQVKLGDDFDMAKKSALLARFQKLATVKNLQLQTCYLAAEQLNTIPVETLDQVAGRRAGQKLGQPPINDYDSRARATEFAKNVQRTQAPQVFRPDPGLPSGQTNGVAVGPLLPVWIDGAKKTGEDSLLVFVRQVRLGKKTLFQGFLTDWPKLRASLLEQVVDLFPDATTHLERFETTAAEDSGQMMATVPAKLTADLVSPPSPSSNATTPILLVAWGGLLLTILAVGFALHSTNRYGERRARFASAVTHELRTPLTTFRMYSEMLADDMVRDPAQRTEYLNTLTREADRLSRLVENVLNYSRLEEGRYNTHLQEITLTALLEGIQPVLLHRTEQVGGRLEIDVGEDTSVVVDVDAIGQILFNLVDNACKYGVGDSHDLIEVQTHQVGDQVSITVSDQGPGIPSEVRKKIFQPFERGTLEAEDNQTPGVGLGLALARALARDLGGELRLDESAAGASFTLVISAPG